ncbi:helix-turn-helix domain-containing protein [Rhizobium rhizogenes]|uniref:helix-turn-helix domain-containing protein n=1 Tax=Rhizobium rhizogenes TaxID=359 RepID=UPI0015729424|nr:helix-turn-helix transcriptional regulator [Rhizobium rhizogenes]NTF72823.1 helix-turn-helix transcriptional regulator [Rhizobium rhizogenes]
MAEAPKKPNQIDIDVGNRIRMRRRLTGMSQMALGEALGVTFQQVQKYEKGTNRVGASRLSDVARVLGVPVSFFFGDEQGKHGENGDQETDVVAQFVGTGEGLALNRSFAKIPDIGVRRKIVALVKTLADEEL